MNKIVKRNESRLDDIGDRVVNTISDVLEWVFTNSWSRNLVFIATMTGGYESLNHVEMSDEVLSGNVVSFGKSGFVWDTYEGQLALGGKNRNSTAYFGLDEQGKDLEGLAAQLEEAVKTGKDVNVHTKYSIKWPWRGELRSVYRVEFKE
ncbi:hypothetical protein ACFL96_18535 [Thermoproteota archaeon]